MKPNDVVEGRFVIERLAGSGGMGKVFRAIDRHAGRAVALKVLHGRSPDHVDRFMREASLLAELRHPGIVGFIARGTTAEGDAYLVMDWLDGESLSQRLDRARPSIAETLALGRAAAEAVHAAHLRGVVHRDLKPGNVFLPNGDMTRPILVDFGIARVNEPGQTLTQTGATLGTPGYMAPEQSRGQPGVDGRADLFSLGCVLYRCLAGVAPFAGDMFTAMLKSVMEPAPPLASYRSDVPPEVVSLLDRLMAKAPDARPRDAATAAVELSALEAITCRAPPAGAARPVTAPPISGPPSSATPPHISMIASPPSLTPMPGPRGTAFLQATDGPVSSPYARPSSLPSISSHPISPAPPRARRWWLVPVIGLAIASGVGATLGVLVLTGALSTGKTGTRSARGTPCHHLRCADYAVSDLSHVDPMTVLPRALSVARSVDRSAAFCSMAMVNAVDGAVQIDGNPGSGAVSLRFRLGKGVRSVDVSPIPGRLIASETTCPHVAAVPACAPRAAYRAAVADGAAKGPATMTYDYDVAMGAGMWTFITNGHPDSYRRIDGRTCAMVKGR